MKVAIIQSSYIPWRGYFDIIDDVDLFIFYDDVQYSRGSWRNRNRIKTDRGLAWITVGVNYSFPQRICDTQVNYLTDWHVQHSKLLYKWYNTAPYFSLYYDEIVSLLNTRFATISQLNKWFCAWAMGKLRIDTPVRCSTEFRCEGQRTERLISLLKQVSATSYVSGPTAKGYIDPAMFRCNDIGLEYKAYDYPEYLQLYDGFEGAVSVLDLLFNVGPNSRDFLKSRSRNTVVV